MKEFIFSRDFIISVILGAITGTVWGLLVAYLIIMNVLIK